MAAPEPRYPFVPKSNAYLRTGQFWAVPLSDRRFACARVLDVPRTPDPHVPVGTRMFLAGLLDWVGPQAPTTESIAGAKLIAQGFAHIKAILTTGGAILGLRDLATDAIVPDRWRSHMAGGTVWLYEGARRLHPVHDDDGELPLMGTWGYSVVRVLAEHRFVGDA